MKKIILLLLTLLFIMSTGAYANWLQIPNTNSWVYFKADGQLAMKEWLQLDWNGDGNYEYYYFDDNGILAVNTVTPDGYTVDSNGMWTVNGVIQYNQVATKNNTIDTTNIEISSSAEKKRELKNNVLSKTNVEFLDTAKIGSKNWANVIKFSGTNSYLKANSGKYNKLSFEAGFKSINENAEYILSIFVNGEEAEVIDNFIAEGQEISIDIDPNSEIILSYSCTVESGKYVSYDSRALYIRKAQFELIKE